MDRLHSALDSRECPIVGGSDHRNFDAKSRVYAFVSGVPPVSWTFVALPECHGLGGLIAYFALTADPGSAPETNFSIC